jgi:hypothetical protein
LNELNFYQKFVRVLNFVCVPSVGLCADSNGPKRTEWVAVLDRPARDAITSSIWANCLCILGANKLTCKIFLVETPNQENNQAILGQM